MCSGAAFLMGLFMLWLGIFKPKSLWQSAGTLNLRRRFGEMRTQCIYVAIGTLLLGLLIGTLGWVVVAFQLLHAAVFSVAVFGAIKLYLWSRRPKLSQKERQLQQQRRQLSKLFNS